MTSAPPRAAWILAASGLLAACGDDPAPREPRVGELILSEVASSNPGGGPGAPRDEHGDYDDWIELFNATAEPLALAGLALSDNPDNPGRYHLPASAPPIPAGGYVLVFADGEAHQGPLHLPFGLARDGEPLVISLPGGAQLASVTLPPLRAGESFARIGEGFVRCGAPTPLAPNRCGEPPAPPKTEYAPYVWPAEVPPVPAGPVVIGEAGPGDLAGTSTTGVWIELWNRGDVTVQLEELSLVAVRTSPAEPLPTTGVVHPIGGALAAGARVLVELPEASPASVMILVLGPGGAPGDLLGIEALEPGTILALPPAGGGLRATCAASSATPGAENGPCAPPPPRRVVPPMLRTLGSLADFDALAGAGEETTSDARSVKFLVDRANGGTVYFIDSARWRLHFDWFWEMVQGRDPFDLCTERARHDTEWGLFSQANYQRTNTRRFYLGTVIRYPDSGLLTFELAPGDQITGPLIEDAFFRVAEAMFDGRRLAFRPNTERLQRIALELEGRLPIVPTERPFEGQTLQTLNPGVGYGVLERVSADEISSAPISYRSILLLDRVPLDLPPVNGTITEELQTPLSHVNVLSQNRGTPNMALRNASEDPRVQPLIGRLVRLEVAPAGFSLRVATATEAQAFWDSRLGERPIVRPERELWTRAILDLEADRGFGDTIRIGAKAAQYAELLRLDFRRWTLSNVACRTSGAPVEARLPVPRPAFAIPFSRYVEHLMRNGIDVELDALLSDPVTLADPVARRDALLALRERIESAPVDPELLGELELLLRRSYGTERVRFRSSTNVEDLSGFNGAGLYESHSAQLGTGVREVEDALRRVWSSLWTPRGFEERELFGIDQSAIAMGVLIHRGFPDEEANGVAITTNVLQPDSHGYYLNAQLGELSVVQPETGDLPEQLLYKFYDPPEIVVLGRSTATGGRPVLSSVETHRLACALSAIHARFQDHYRPRLGGEPFAVDVEWKLAGPERALVVKQARPWSRGHALPGPSCEDP